MDAPAHFIENGATIDTLDLDILIGDCLVVASDAASLDADTFAALQIPEKTRRLLVKTSNSKRFSGHEPFFEDYVGVTANGARWLIENGIALLGIDYLSVAEHPEIEAVHHLLLGNDVVLLETLNLRHVVPGAYQLVALPLRLENIDGSPVRAVLVGQG
jgi:arylformamidase